MTTETTLSDADVATIQANTPAHVPVPAAGDAVPTIHTPGGRFVFLDHAFHWLAGKVEGEKDKEVPKIEADVSKDIPKVEADAAKDLPKIEGDVVKDVIPVVEKGLA